MKNDIMYDDILYFKEMIQKYNIDGHNDDYYVWTIACVNYFFYNGNLNKENLKSQWTDGGGDGEIDYIYDDKETNTLYLIQGKSEGKLNFNGIKTEFQKMSDTIKIFSKNQEDKYGFNKKLKRAFKKGIENKKTKDIVLVLFTNTPISSQTKEKLSNWKDFKYTTKVFGKDEIYEKKVVVSTGEKNVKKGTLICSSDNVLKYSNGKNNGVILNIKARSLKDLYDKEMSSALFGYNLREYIKDSRDPIIEVDANMQDTIKDKPESFWFFNNGITIGCSDFSIDNNKLTLKNFSIINGAQTTHIIGEATIKKDFDIVCKVVKSAHSLDDEFIKNISKCSNSQKAIEARDLYANAKEQVWLQYNFIRNEHPLAVRIKRGVQPSNYDKVKNWERIENSTLGQIILAAYLQKPGTARSNPNVIFNKEDVYESIFNMDIVKNYNYNALYVLVQLNDLCNSHKKQLIKAKETQMEKLKKQDKIDKIKTDIGIIKNSGYTIIAAITYLIKRKYFNLPGIRNNSDEEWQKLINKEIDTNLSLNYEGKDYKSKVKRLFDLIIEKLTEAYNDEKGRASSKIDNPSNYFKRDDLYRTQIVDILDDIVDNHKNDEIMNLLQVFDDKNRDK